MNKKLKAQIRAELFRCAVAGKFLTYKQFFSRIRPGVTMGNFPYQTHFDQIAKEERSHGYPDITFLVHGKGGYPHQIDFQPAIPTANTNQLRSLRKGTDKIIALYCPRGTSNPY
jgi:hypothetical protein